MDDLISRTAALRCIKESRENIDWGQSEDGDAFLHYTVALYRTMASAECIPAVDAVPVAHGQWDYLATEHNAYWWMVDANCSCCGFVKHNVWSGFFPDVSPAIAKSVALRYASRINLPRYCESCGARMDGDTSAAD